MSRSLLFFLAGLLLVCACKTTKKTEAGAAPPDVVMDESFHKLITDKELFTMTRDIIPVDTVYLSTDTLHLVTKKIQACHIDNFKLIWNGMILKSLPAQANVKLFLLTEPTCKEQHSFHLLFNITPIHFKPDSIRLDRTTMIRVGNWKHTLRYDF